MKISAFVAMINQGKLIQSGNGDELVRQLAGNVWLLKRLPSELPAGS